ncbi:hypothetical protein BDF22DRAFT_652225 [Syncephalis plumigaleata]|nr:hypothetical protein BDF22DRAFT_652225 [Syncephalis plumigaleata]
MSNYYQSVQKHEKEHEEETRQPIVNDTASISSNSPGISIIIVIIDTSQHANHEADEEHWIDYIYIKDSAIPSLIRRAREVRTVITSYAELIEKALWGKWPSYNHIPEELPSYNHTPEELKAEKQRLDLFGTIAFEKKQDHKDEIVSYLSDYHRLYTDYNQSYILRNEQDKDIIK